jgi:hypothetical protein
MKWIKAATGSLGQGLSVGVGMALAQRLMRSAAGPSSHGDGECAEARSGKPPTPPRTRPSQPVRRRRCQRPGPVRGPGTIRPPPPIPQVPGLRLGRRLRGRS